ncbi:MAG: 30S ribosomal protein S4 [Candidatus Anstonellales archaeon]
MMGDPRKLKKKYKAPKKIWDSDRITKESELKEKYGLKNMTEIWKAATELRKVRTVARESLSLPEEKKRKNQELIIGKLNRLGILQPNASLDDVLSLTTEHFLERRLQTLVYKKGIAKSILQARQLITHGFIEVGGRRLTAPGYLVRKDQEDSIKLFKPYKMPEGPKPEAPMQPKDNKAEGQRDENEVGVAA